MKDTSDIKNSGNPCNDFTHFGKIYCSYYPIPYDIIAGQCFVVSLPTQRKTFINYSYLTQNL